MNFTSFTPIILLTTFIITGQNLVRYLKAKDWNGSAGIVLSFLIGWAAVAVCAHAGVTEHLVLVQGQPELGLIDGWSILLLGIGVGSLGPVTVDFFKSRDNTQTAGKPPLVNAKGDYAADSVVEGTGG